MPFYFLLFVFKEGHYTYAKVGKHILEMTPFPCFWHYILIFLKVIVGKIQCQQHQAFPGPVLLLWVYCILILLVVLCFHLRRPLSGSGRALPYAFCAPKRSSPGQMRYLELTVLSVPKALCSWSSDAVLLCEGVYAHAPLSQALKTLTGSIPGFSLPHLVKH